MKTLELNEELIFTLEENKKLKCIGEVSGTFNVVPEQILLGGNVTIISDSNGVYLIIN